MPTQYYAEDTPHPNQPAAQYFDRIKSKVVSSTTPGPGNYNLRSTLNLGKGVSFGGKAARKLRPEATSFGPGPGQYTPKYLESTPKVSIRDPYHKKGPAQATAATTQTPGPGQYNIASSPIRPGKGAPIGGRPSAGKPKLTPGPGQYDLRSTLSTKGVPMGVKVPMPPKARASSPGPGQYNAELPRTTGPQYTMGPRPPAEPKVKKTALPTTPGPGQYDAARSTISKTGGVVMGKAPRPKPKGADNIPGPGQYSEPPTGTFGNSGPRYSMGVKPRDRAGRAYSPGPGQYGGPVTDAAHGSHGPAFSFGTAPRRSRSAPLTKDTAAAFVPGPGQYDTRTPLSTKGVVFASSGRSANPTRRADPLPGPGQYNADHSTISGPKFSIAGKHSESKRSFSPGPGQYTPAMITPNAPSVKIAEGHKRPQRQTTNTTPGPGNYNADLPALGGHGAVPFGSRPGASKNDATPGPGQYNLRPN